MVHWNEKKARKLALAKIAALFALGLGVIVISEGHGTARSAGGQTLEKIARFDLGVPELSGITLRPLPGTAGEVELVGIGDKGGQLARLPLSVAHPENLASRAPHVVDLEPMLLATLTLCDPTAPERCAPAMRQAAAQWEALATDASGRLFALQETHDSVVGLAPGLDRVDVVLHLDFGMPKAKSKSSAKHRKKRNSRGEGLLLLKGGHILVAVESKPAVIIELGPEGGAARGFSPAQLLSPGESFSWSGTPTPGGAVPRGRLVALARWRLGDERHACDAADLAVDEAGRLLVLSQSCAAITAYDSLEVGDAKASATQRFALPGKLRHAEALAVLPGGRFLVGEDFKTLKKSLHVLGIPEPSPDFATLVDRLWPRI
jgi:hypothetical protein